MLEQTALDRIQPCILIRLSDDEPDVKNESRDQRVLSLSRYRASVIRDLENLLNARSYPPLDEIYEFSEAAKSVINFGIRDLCGMTLSEFQDQDVERQIEQAIKCFEPRLLPHSLVVRLCSSSEKNDFSGLTIEIEGKLWAQPIADHLFIKTQVDVETGHFEFKG